MNCEDKCENWDDMKRDVEKPLPYPLVLFLGVIFAAAIWITHSFTNWPIWLVAILAGLILILIDALLRRGLESAIEEKKVERDRQQKNAALESAAAASSMSHRGSLFLPVDEAWNESKLHCPTVYYGDDGQVYLQGYRLKPHFKTLHDCMVREPLGISVARRSRSGVSESL